jgi:hypothetical protein
MTRSLMLIALVAIVRVTGVHARPGDIDPTFATFDRVEVRDRGLGRVRVVVKATEPGSTAAFAPFLDPTNPVIALTVIPDAPTATSGQCATTPLTGPPPLPTCTIVHGGNSLTCK